MLKKTVMASPTPKIWDPEALYLKSQRYVQRMQELNSDEWEYGLWAGFSLEFLARAALANISPALLAEVEKNWPALPYALGFNAIVKKTFPPKSIAISDVFKRLEAILPDFFEEHTNFAIQHTSLRNVELHTGELAFDGVKNSAWQPRFYQTSQILLSSMGLNLVDFLGNDEAEVAKQLIAAAMDESAKAVKGDVFNCAKAWNSKPEAERQTLSSQAMIWASRQTGHRTNCPACNSQGLVYGRPVSTPIQRINDGEITETQDYLPSHFECVACGLKINGLSRLTAVDIGDRYKKTLIYDAAEYYAPDDEYEGYEEDNNEP